MEMKQVNFDDVPADRIALVMMGCDIDTLEKRNQFITGLTDLLVQENVMHLGTKPEQVWESVNFTVSLHGRHDVVFTPFKEAFVNMARLTVIRTRVRDLKWVADWKDYAYNHFPRTTSKSLEVGEDCDTDY